MQRPRGRDWAWTVRRTTRRPVWPEQRDQGGEREEGRVGRAQGQVLQGLGGREDFDPKGGGDPRGL